MKSEDLMYPSRSFLSTVDVRQLLPQQDPFVMVGRMVHFDPMTTTTETPIEASCLFVDTDGLLSAEGMVEAVAQTCAVRIGYVGKYIEHRPLAIGVVGAVSGLKVNGRPRVGDVITTTITVREELFGITLITGVVSSQGQPLLTTSMKLGIRR